MSILENKITRNSFGRAAITYMKISVFCILFYLIYDRFSHGVHSPYMTGLFGWPFVLGVLPSLFFGKCKASWRPNRISINIWNSGVAALTVSSLLRGTFEIAGTASKYQEWLMVAGGIMLICAVLFYTLRSRIE